MKFSKIILALILLTIFAVPAVCAITQELGNGGVTTGIWYGYDTVADGLFPSGGSAGPTEMIIDGIMYNTNLNSVGWVTMKGSHGTGRGQYSGGSDSDFRNMSATIPIPDAGSRVVQCYIGTDRVGKGTLQYNTYNTYNNFMVAMSFYPDDTDWDLTGYSGTQMINFTYSQAPLQVGMGGHNRGFTQIGQYLQNATYPRIGSFMNRTYSVGMDAEGGPWGYDSRIVDAGFAGYYFFSFWNSYELTRSNTTGTIHLTVTKTMEDTNRSFASWVYLSKGSGQNYYPVWSESTLNTVDIVNEPFATVLPLEVDIKDYMGNWWNGTTLYDVAAFNEYQILLDNETIGIGQALNPRIYSTSDVSLTSLSRIHWQQGPSTGSVNEIPVGGNASRWQYYVKQSGTWYGWDETVKSFSVNMGGTAPNPISFSFTTAGTKTLYADLYTTGGTNFWLTKNVTVSGTDYCTAVVYVVDKEGSFVSGSEVDIQDLTTGTWTNQSTSTGITSYKSPPGSVFHVYASKSGYESSDGTYSAGSGGQCVYTIITMPLWKSSTISTNTDLVFRVVDDNTQAAISGATVKIDYTDPWTSLKVSTQLTTNSAGTAEFNVSNSTDISWSVKKSNYLGQSGSLNSGTTGFYQQAVFLVPSGTVTTLTTSPTVATATPTGVPTMTGGNYTGFWAPVYTLFHSMGASDLELPILSTMAIVFVGLIIGAGATGFTPAGATIGVAAGLIIAAAIWISLVYIAVISVILIFIWIFFIK